MVETLQCIVLPIRDHVATHPEGLNEFGALDNLCRSALSFLGRFARQAYRLKCCSIGQDGNDQEDDGSQKHCESKNWANQENDNDE